MSIDLTVPGSDLADLYEFAFQELKTHQITCARLLVEDDEKIASKIGRPVWEIKQIKEKLRAEIDLAVTNSDNVRLPQITMHENSFFTTGDEGLDSLLGNYGIQCGALTEIAGESGTGKSKLLAQLAVSVQLPHHLNGLDRGCVYISNERQMHAETITQLAEKFQVTADRVLCMSPESQDKLDHLIRYILPAIVDKHNIGLIIIDSISGSYRYRTDLNKFQNRQLRNRSLTSLVRDLRNICTAKNIAAVVSNEMSVRRATATSSVDFNISYASEQARWTSGWEEETILYATDNSSTPYVSQSQRLSQPSTEATPKDTLTPALGITWANLVSTRIALKRFGKKRIMHLAFCPYAPSDDMEFSIDDDGVHGLDVFTDFSQVESSRS